MQASAADDLALATAAALDAVVLTAAGGDCGGGDRGGSEMRVAITGTTASAWAQHHQHGVLGKWPLLPPLLCLHPAVAGDRRGPGSGRLRLLSAQSSHRLLSCTHLLSIVASHLSACGGRGGAATGVAGGILQVNDSFSMPPCTSCSTHAQPPLPMHSR